MAVLSPDADWRLIALVGLPLTKVAMKVPEFACFATTAAFRMSTVPSR